MFLIITSRFTVPPSITQVTPHQNVTEGNNVTLSCIVSGIPSPVVSWVSPNGQHLSGRMLEVTKINRSQAGAYKCEARNECGNATKTTNIDVNCKCNSFFFANSLC